MCSAPWAERTRQAKALLPAGDRRIRRCCVAGFDAVTTPVTKAKARLADYREPGLGD
jgi:hypothetical protein